MSDTARLREDFQTELRGLLDAMARATSGLAPGPRRLLVGVEAFWEACYRRRDAAERILQSARSLDSEQDLARRALILERLLASELRACGVVAAETLAPDLAAEIAAVTRAECLAAQRLPALRRRLIGFVESRTGLPSLWTAVAA